jgi:hypothetical protein
MPAPPPAPELPPVEPPIELPPIELPPMEPPAEMPPELLEDPPEPPLPDAPLVGVPLLDGARALSPQPAKPIVSANAHACAQRTAPRGTISIVCECAERALEIRFSSRRTRADHEKKRAGFDFIEPRWRLVPSARQFARQPEIPARKIAGRVIGSWEVAKRACKKGRVHARLRPP